MKTEHSYRVCGRGGIGRRARFRSVWATMGVRIPSTAPKQKDIHMDVFFHTKTERIRTREGMSVIRMSCDHSNSEWSEGDRAGSRGGSLQARRSRRSAPFDRTRYSGHLECMVVKPSR